MNQSNLWTVVALVLTSGISRFLPHPPNFTAINAVALFSGAYLGRRTVSLLVVFLSMFLSDLVIGFHSVMPFVYFSFGLTVLMGFRLKKSSRSIILPLYLVASSVLFFLISNFGVWILSSFYPKTWGGLEVCYVAALPFFRNQVLGDLVYGAVLFGSLVFAEKIFLVAQYDSSARVDS